MRGALLVAAVAAALCANEARAEKPAVASIAVETTATAEVVRLGIAPASPTIRPEIVCGEDAIRVRLEGVAARSEDVEEVAVPAAGPMKRVRFAPRGGGSVVQITTAGRPLPACNRTTALQLGAEVIVSMALTEGEKAKLAARAATAAALAAAAVPAATPPAEAPEVVAPFPAPPAAPPAPAVAEMDPAKAPPPKAGAADGKEPKAAAPLVFGVREKKDAPPIVGGDTGSNGVRYAGAIAFAGLVAGAALWIKRRKKRGVGELSDEIDIISAKRLSAHQQLIVAQVQGVKILLAVGDKTVTNLGTIAEPARPAQAAAPRPASVAPVLEPPRSALDGLLEEPRREARGFDRELASALDRAARIPAPAPEPRGRGPESASNVAGLLSMARMRASLKDQRRGPQAEA